MRTREPGVPGLGKLLLMGRDPEIRCTAARSLAETGDVSAYAWLRQALWDPHEGVRASAVEAVGSLAVRQSAGELAAVYAWAGARLRRSVLRAVLRMSGTAGFDGLLRLAADDPDRTVRALAGRAARVRAGRS